MLQCGLVCRHRSKAPRSKTHQLNFSAQETVMQHLNLIPRAQLCEKLGVSRSTLKRWVKTRNFPNPIKASGRGSKP